MSAADLIRLYENEGRTIFPTSSWLGAHLGALMGAKYDAKGIDATLQKYFGDTRLQEALTRVLVPRYDIEKQVPIFLKSDRARDRPDYDFPMRDVARATSAAPTYFTPEKIETADRLNYYALIDGGVVAGNPAMCAYAEAIRDQRAVNEGVLMLSLGTG